MICGQKVELEEGEKGTIVFFYYDEDNQAAYSIVQGDDGEFYEEMTVNLDITQRALTPIENIVAAILLLTVWIFLFFCGWGLAVYI